MKFKFISKHFPSPRSLKPPHIGVSFSDTSIKAMAFDGASIKPNLKSILIPLEKGAIVSGGIADMEEVVKKLSIIKENFNSPFVFFTIPDELAYVFTTLVPVGSASNITESIAFVMEENVPLSLNDTIFDFVPVKIVQSDSGHTVSVVVAACVKKEAEKFTEAFHKSGLEPVGCIHESQAIAKAVMPRKFVGTSCIVHVRENRIGIHLVKRGIIHFSTIRNVSDGNYKKDFMDEHDKFLEYYLKYDVGQNQPIKSIFVCGEFEYAKEVIEAAVGSKECPKDVKLSNVWTNVFDIDKHLPDIPFEKSLSFAGSIGAALSDII